MFYPPVPHAETFSLSAAKANALSDLLNALPPQGAEMPHGGFCNDLRITVRNNSSDLLESGAPVVPASLQRLPERADLRTFIFDIHRAFDPQKTFWLLCNPIPSGEIGEAIVAGIAPGTVTIEQNDHEYARSNSSGILVSANSGPVRILWKAADTGTAKAIFHLGSGIAADESNDYRGMFKAEGFLYRQGESPCFMIANGSLYEKFDRGIFYNRQGTQVSVDEAGGCYMDAGRIVIPTFLGHLTGENLHTVRLCAQWSPTGSDYSLTIKIDDTESPGFDLATVRYDAAEDKVIVKQLWYGSDIHFSERYFV